MSYGRVVHVVQNANEFPPPTDLALLVTLDSRSKLTGVSEKPKLFYVEAILNPQLPCFEATEGDGECVPFRRPVYMRVVRAQLR